MPKESAFFGKLVRPPRASAEEIQVELEDGRSLRLDAREDRERSAAVAGLLAELHRLGRPVYLELAADGRRLERIHPALVVRVAELRGGDGEDVEVELEISHARHVLRRDSPDYAELLAALRRGRESRSPVAVAETEDHEILAVRPFEEPAEGPPDLGSPVEARPAVRLSWWRRLLRRILSFRRCVTAKRARQLFDLVAGRTCAPLAPAPPCIPFLYPDDGCWGRAHEMCRLLIDTGARPRKVWIYGSLTAPTKNHPSCAVSWGWHVAPTLCVRSGCFFGRQEMVIDPSLFTGPVPKATWKGAQGDPGASLESSHWTIFHRSSGGGSTQTDPGFTSTNQVLTTYRGFLQARSINVGPPPYAHC